MRLLIIHADEFMYEPTEKSSTVSSISAPDWQSRLFTECLVVLTTIEQGDVNNAECVLRQATEEVALLVHDLRVDTIVVYPYAHLSPNLAPTHLAADLVRDLADCLAKEIPDSMIQLAPFGWYKAFRLTCKGHPRSETFREISCQVVQPSNAADIKEHGRAHPVNALKYRMRDIFLSLGFSEVINPAIIAENDVYKQYGPEAPLILDRVFYLAGLPRPDIGISDDEWIHVLQIAPAIKSRESLTQLFRNYKQGKIESDDLIAETVRRMKIDEGQAIDIFDKVFPQLKSLQPVPTRKTLRSHMTALWFPLLQKYQRKAILPLKLFSIGARFRREQREDSHHLFESTSSSIVVMDDDFTIEDGQRLTRDILLRLGFRNCHFKPKVVTSNYYEQGTDTEVYAQFSGQELEIANIGFYSSKSLSHYEIKHQVFNLGFGVERLAMIFEGAQDIRKLVYPVLYEEVDFSDVEILISLAPICTPSSSQGIDIKRKILQVINLHKNELGPKEVLAYCGDFLGADVQISFYNWDVERPMLGAAGMNEVVVHNGGIYGLPRVSAGLSGDLLRAFDEGQHSGLIYIELLVDKALSDLELAISNRKRAFDIQFKMIRSLDQVNLTIPSSVRDWIRSQQNSISIRGPIFAGIRAEIVYNE